MVKPPHMPTIRNALMSAASGHRPPLIEEAAIRPNQGRAADVDEDGPQGNIGPVIRATATVIHARATPPSALPTAIQR